MKFSASPMIFFFLLSCRTESNYSNSDVKMIGGAPADRVYEAAGTLLWKGNLLCTATLIAPTLILTAKHCTTGGGEEEGDSGDIKPSQTTFVLGEITAQKSITRKLKRWYKPTAIPVDGYIDLPDIALGELRNPIETVTPMALSLNPVREEEIGAVFESIGFGISDPSGVGPATGKRELAKFQLAAIEGSALMKIHGSKENFVTYLKSKFPGEEETADRFLANGELTKDYEVHAYDPNAKSDTCSGDSGGPLLRLIQKDGSETREVVGVTSRGFRGETSGCVGIGTIFSVFGPEVINLFQTLKIGIN